MNDAELYEVLIQMIDRFEGLSELQRIMQYDTIEAKFSERELKNLIFALKTLKAVTELRNKERKNQ